MIGRAAMTNPFIFKQVLEPEFKVSPQMRVELTLHFLRSLLQTLEPREALHRIKKIGGWFTKGIPGGAQFRHQLNEKNDPEELLAELEALKEQLHGREE
jgi:tRNA-dihydrouridine synthase B